MCSLIAAAVLLLTPLEVASSKIPLTLDDILNNGLLSHIEKLEWIDADRIIMKSSEKLQIIDTSKSPPVSSVFANEEVLARNGKIASRMLSHDAKYMALSFDEHKDPGKLLYRIYVDEDATFENVGPNRTGDEMLQLFQWNPKSNAFVFVHENDIYYSDSPHSKKIERVTRSNDELIFNGLADWIYEEEIFASNVGLWWSSSGDYLAYVTIDDRKVKMIEFSMFEKKQYPELRKIPYPKTGVNELPQIKLSIWNRNTKESRQMKILLRHESLSTYLFSASWIKIRGRDLLVAVFANRFQNLTSVTLCTFESGECVLNYAQRYSLGGQHLWAEPEDYRIRHHTNDSYFVNLPHRRPSGNTYTQVAKVSVPPFLKDGLAEFLTMGDYDVISISGYSDEKNEVYFVAAAPLPSQRHLFATSASPRAAEGALCITCSSSPNCSYQEVIFSENMDKYILVCRGPGMLHVYLSSVSSNNTILKEFAESKTAEQKYNEKAFASPHFENVTLDNGYVALVKMLLPPNFDKGTVSQKYPAIVSVYAGPGSQRVSEDSAPTSLDTLLASSMKYILIFIDGRGSGMRGWKYKAPIYGNFGTVEVEDQVETVRILAARHSFIDSRNIAIWGWSYGGFVAAHAIERDNKRTFKCAVSVAPVSDFKLYDATYTERYMGAASELAYERANLIKNVSNFKNIKYLLVHGTGDDNVHLQNSMEFMRALDEQEIQYQLMIYPDATHNIQWPRRHLYLLLIDFFDSCFRP